MQQLPAKLILAGLLALLFSAAGQAQQVVKPCIPVVSNTSGLPVTSCQDVSGSNPLPVTGTFTPSSTSNQKVNIDQSVPGTSNGVVDLPSSAASAGVTKVTSASLAANQIIDGAPGNLFSFQVSADSALSAAAWWVMIYDAVSAPGDGAVTPAKCYALPSGATSIAAAWPTPVAFGTGITIGVSTTGCFNKTASTHAFISGDFK